jgi:phosphoglycerate dehydrogenase-like enzyme
MLAESDFVVLALPLTDSTQNIIDAEALAAMKPTAYLINVGRGELIDEGALIKALQENQMAGAVLDVFVDEPLPEDNPLWEMSNVIVSPHISWFSRYFKSDTLSLFIENLNRFLENQPLYNRVDPKMKY